MCHVLRVGNPTALFFAVISHLAWYILVVLYGCPFTKVSRSSGLSFPPSGATLASETVGDDNLGFDTVSTPSLDLVSEADPIEVEMVEVASHFVQPQPKLPATSQLSKSLAGYWTSIDIQTIRTI